ncbi:hypothetical protein NQ314_004377 [Rhamnusium bicolor]|uniref:VWFC domain-containing protein n=1 Tax=Rhamnusium bicolor TaxID=1586634 RepID=A0AAV8ZLD9_9CUCU|nr:hypothetical protein NQ314_004377 [Rhamnusium bicolor]
MFCWWQDCPPTMEGPCRDRGPFSPCISVPASPQASSTSSSTGSTVTTKLNTVSSSSTITTSQELSSNQATENLGSITDNNLGRREYQIGDKLPHDTGNCIECICDQGAKVTCSPHQCAPAGDEINDYRPPGPRQPIPDVF